ncbi:MAG TPA: ABC transporter ATP-binding protein [Firmicutes bacterium]|nr:ABC transporter ATP-binding protein [Bacillota bacterium]
MAVLSVEDLHVYYGAIHAIKGVSFHVEPGEIVTLIGANGAGKSTILKTISGIIRPKKGKIRLKGDEIHNTPPHGIVSMGVSHVPEGRRVFPNLTVLENLQVGAYTRREKREIEESLEDIWKRFPRLRERMNQMAGTLSGGEQQMLAIARALMSKPQLLLMDEPSMGLSPMLVDEVFDTIKEINASGTTILLVEQNAQMALEVANRGYVLETGEIVLQGNAQELADNPEVRKAYLGES